MSCDLCECELCEATGIQPDGAAAGAECDGCLGAGVWDRECEQCVQEHGWEMGGAG